MTLLVVDDEYYIVQGIVEDVDGESLGISEIQIAYSMKQAQEVLQSHKIDILLSDIEMPRGSGLDLVNWCTEEGYDPVTLLLTGHQNFEYIRRAIGLRCLDYLLKPINPNQLNDHLKKAAEEVEHKRKRNRESDQAEHWRLNREARIATFWSRLLTDEIAPDRDEIVLYMEEQQLSVDWLDGTYYLCFFSFEKKTSPDKEKQMTRETIKELLLDHGLAASQDPILKLSDREFALPVAASPSRGYGLYCGEMENILPLIAERISSPVSVYIAFESPLENLSSRLKELKKAATEIKGVGNRVIPADIMKIGERPCGAMNVDIPMEKWSEWLHQYKTKLIKDDLERILREEFKYYSSQKLISLYHGVIRLIYSCFSSYKNVDAGHLSSRITSYEDLNQAVLSMNNFLFWAESVLSEAVLILKEESDSRSLIRKVRNIVQAQLNWDGLSRSFIAEEIHMNPDYLSHLFHKKSGQSLVSFINQERIELAKKLLLTSDMTMSLIAETVGYFNIPNFYRQFKRITGMTPKQFKESVGKW